MNKLLVLAVLAVGAIGVAQAGSVGAGPGGTGSLATGTVVTPASLVAALFGTAAPGRSGTIRVSPDRAHEVFAYLAQQPGAVVSGTTAAADGAFANGARFRISVDTAAGTLTLSRL